MLRKQIISEPGAVARRAEDEIDIAAVATVQVSSEDPLHPIDHAFDRRRGSGATRWVAGQPGEQTLILVFDEPQTIERVCIEVEERERERTQQLRLGISTDGGRNYRELVQQDYNFSPSGATLEREDWAVAAPGVTHLRLVIRPDTGGRPCFATLTSLLLR